MDFIPANFWAGHDFAKVQWSVSNAGNDKWVQWAQETRQYNSINMKTTKIKLNLHLKCEREESETVREHQKEFESKEMLRYCD